MDRESSRVGRRALLTGAALTAVAAAARAQSQPAPAEPATTLADVPLGPSATITVERRGDDRARRPQPSVHPEPARSADAGAAGGDVLPVRARSVDARGVLFGHGEHFSRGIDVDASQAAIHGGAADADRHRQRSIRSASRQPHRTKPVVVVVHGDTWNLGHELYLAGDIRIAAANTRFGQDENTHGRFPGGGATVRFVREAGWGNAMRYMLTGDHWSAEESYRMGDHAVRSRRRPRPRSKPASRWRARSPRAVRCRSKPRSLSAHQVIDPVEADALSKLDAAVRRALPDRGLHRRPARRGRRPAAQISGEVMQ